MSEDRRTRYEYSPRQTEAARRVLADLSTLLEPFKDCMVLVGGWVPDLRAMESGEDHVGSIDVDIALEADRLGAEGFAELIQVLLDTKRYRPTDEAFSLYTLVDLHDGESSVRVDVDFLKPPGTDLKTVAGSLPSEIRPMDAEGCEVAFEHAEVLLVPGQRAEGASLASGFRVASVAGFLVMKSHAMFEREKPKDAYDICYCLQHHPGGMKELVERWRAKRGVRSVDQALLILGEKFSTVQAEGPRRLVEFYDSSDPEERQIQARRAYELVQGFLKLVAEA